MRHPTTPVASPHHKRLLWGWGSRVRFSREKKGGQYHPEDLLPGLSDSLPACHPGQD